MLKKPGFYYSEILNKSLDFSGLIKGEDIGKIKFG